MEDKKYGMGEQGLVVKAMRNRLGEWGVFWGVSKATRLAYLRFFKSEETAKRWAEKFRKKMLRK